MTASDEVKKCAKNAGYCYQNIYFIKNKAGEKVKYIPNAVQRELIFNRHTRNVVPKARQHGITTAIAIHFLNCALQQDYQTAAIIAHRESDAIKIFDTKIKFVYDNILPQFKKRLPSIVRCNSNTLALSNGSIITADTMVRSTTLNYLHISELGKMAAWYPMKAEEVKTGAFPAAERGEIFVESTMEGNTGLMAELCDTARNLMLAEEPLTKKDFKFFFFPWWANPEYSLGNFIQKTEADEEYFLGLVSENIHLTPEQINWYLKEKSILGIKMQQEYPSTFDEAIAVSVEGAFFRKQIIETREEKRIRHVPYDSHSLVYAAADIGFTDATAIVLFQLIRGEIHIIDHMEGCEEEIGYFMNWLVKKSYNIERIFLPHDAKAMSLQTGKCIDELVRENFGYKTTVMSRVSHEILDIDHARNMFRRCFFDQSKCTRLIECLTLFSKEYNKRLNMWLTKSRHDEYRDSAKAFIYMCRGVEHLETYSSDSEYSSDDLRSMKFRPIFN